METITVNLGTRSYPIHIGSGALASVGALLQEQQLSTERVAVITDTSVAHYYRESLVRSLTTAGFKPLVIEIPPGEQQKNLGTLSGLYDTLIKERLERRAPLIALGGGVIGDLTGFAAATFQRGVPFVQVPTTLLAQIDASVGGKTAVNHPAGKNLIGAFYQPRLVLIDVDTLKTLPRREFLAGLAEVIKYGVILSPDLFVLLEERLQTLLALDPPLLTAIIKTCCQLKALVVEEDETEGDYRAILNFGHTLGHAVESATAYTRFLHGEAVAVGMAFAARLSSLHGICGQATQERICRLIQEAGLPLQVPEAVTKEDLMRSLQADKKMANGKVKFVCLEEIGKTRFMYMSAQEIVHSL